MKRVAIVGYGAIGRSIANQLLRSSRSYATLVAIQMRDHQVADGKRDLPSAVLSTSTLDEALDQNPDIVIEAAGHAAVAECGPAALSRGCELYVLSTGALAVDELYERLSSAARRGGGRISIPSGALAGFDGLLSMRAAGLTAVTYRSTKPPAAWRGTEAEWNLDIDNLRAPHTVFSGTARQAALRFPRNANLAVAIALAGVGLEATRVELIADPGSSGNIGHVLAQGLNSSLEVKLTNAAHDRNPKTSEITGYSVLAALENNESVIRFQ